MNGVAVSVVVPVYNGAARLGAAVDSILSQGQPPREIIVVDDGSSDDTPAIIAGFGDRIIALRQGNQGPSAARNAGLARATAPFVIFLDADDLWLSTTLEELGRGLEGDPAVDAIWGLTERVVSPDVTADLEDWHGRPQWTIALGSILFRRAVLEALGGLDETLRCGEDFDLMVRFTEGGFSIRRHPAVVHIRQMHGENNFALDETAMREGHFRVIARTFARRRSRRLTDTAGR